MCDVTACLVMHILRVCCYRPVDGVHSQDLDSSVYYSLWLEVASHADISGSKLTAVQQYVSVLARYYGASVNVKRFLVRLDTWLKTIQQPISSADWRKQLQDLQVQQLHVTSCIDLCVNNQMSFFCCLGMTVRCFVPKIGS